MESNQIRTVTAALLLLLSGSGVTAQNPLDRVVSEALQRNLGLRQQELAHERSEAGVRQARGLFLPSLSLDARYSEMHGGLDFGELVNPAYAALNQLTNSNAFPTGIDGRYPFAQETRVRLAQPLFNASILANYRLSNSLEGAQAARTRAAARQLAADAQLAWLNHARAAEAVKVRNAALELVKEHERVSERLLENGKVTPDAVFRARAQRAEAEQDYTASVQLQQAALRWLNFLLDRPAETAVAEATDSVVIPDLQFTVQELVSRARVAREELQQADFGIKAADAQERLARASYLPSVAVAVDYGVQGNKYRFDTRNDVAMASIVVQWNVFNGLQDAARVEQASLEAERGRVQRTQLENQLELEVRQAWDAYKVAQASVSVAGERLEAAKRTFELVSRRYQEGAASALELLDARTTYTAAELNQVVTRYDYAAKYVELERAAALRDLDVDLAKGRE